MIEVLRRALRERVCAVCFMRPVGSESLGPLVPRDCEQSCSIFCNLVPLRKIAACLEQNGGPTGQYESAMCDTICSRCPHATISGGDFCPKHLAETCPLAVYGQRVIETIDLVREESQRQKTS